MELEYNSKSRVVLMHTMQACRTVEV